MFWNFIKIAWRHLTKNPVITFIQIFGLTAGLTVFLLLSLWVNNQISFDKFGGHENRVCRVEFYSPEYSGWTEHALALGPILQEQIPEVEKVVRLKFMNYQGKLIYAKEQNPDKLIEVTHNYAFWGDSTFFEVFPFEFIYGNPKTALLESHSIVLQESVSKKLFNDEYPIGKQVTDHNNNVLTVTGIIKDVNNFHIPFQTIKPISLLKQHYKNSNIEWDTWKGYFHPTYVLLKPNTDVSVVESKITSTVVEIMKRSLPQLDSNQMEYKLRPLKNIYFFGKTEKEFSYVLHGNIRLITGLTFVALLILLLAGINFINLNTTRTFFRTKETGIRKIAGSDRKHIFIQFTGEVAAICLFVLALSVALVYIALPYYNNLIGTQLFFRELLSSYNLITIAACLLLLIIFTGIVPSWLLSAYSPAAVLRNLALYTSKRGNFTRKALLVLQYSITIIVLSVTLLVVKQTHFMKNSDIGMNLSNVLRYEYPYLRQKEKMNTWIERLLECPSITHVSYSMTVPGINFEPGFVTYAFEGKTVETYGIYCYPELLDLLEIPVIEGRGFIPGNKADESTGDHTLRVILNEAAVKAYGLKNPVGTMGTVNNRRVEIIGVARDSHFSSLKLPIPPTIITNWPEGGYNVLIRFIPGNIKDVKAHMTKIAKEVFNVDWEPKEIYLEDLYNSQYESEEKLGEMFIWFSLLSVLIAALGMYGISANAIHRRVREIGLRKANGASVWDIMALIQTYFGKIVIWSGILAVPIAWFLALRWIRDYPYRTNISWWIFAGSLLLAILVAIATTSWKTWRAANGNPVDALRYE
ncbi:FtsX-like permease family protein [Prolixibacteraceae bacterium Z1-6]|uniref:FtsX-like permease family protein n=1 Tax=Draconibacterium aestuarii TaxID=2998507 RepID=A0A9X3J4E8_9BACT|nr:FtsX-like permease family protein [Prolixibacteraceae bacterium Z1-6]